MRHAPLTPAPSHTSETEAFRRRETETEAKPVNKSTQFYSVFIMVNSMT